MHTSEWRSCATKEVVGIVLRNFPGGDLLPDYGLNVILGDRLRIIEENDLWYRGWILDRESDTGIFPKNVACLKPATIESGPRSEEIVTFTQETQVAQEIYNTLKEWNLNARELFLAGDVRLENLRKLTYDLVELRKQILSGTLPSDELRRLQREAVVKLDEGNSLLGLDTIIRDEEGVVIDLDKVSLVEIYRYFKAAPLKSIQLPLNQPGVHKFPQPYCFLVTIKSIGLKVGDDCELIVSLYDEEKQQFITENCVLEWRSSKQGLLENGGKMVFADLKKMSDPTRVYFVCQIVRRGAMEWKENGMMEGKKGGQSVRRPLGVAATDVTGMLQRGRVTEEEEEEKSDVVAVVMCGESESLGVTLRKAIILKNADQKGQSVMVVSGKLLQGNIKQVREDYPHLFVGNPPVSRILGYPDVVVPADVRNDIYITLDRAEFKHNGRNVEVSVSVCDERKAVLPEAVCPGSGMRPSEKHQSVVYYHEDKPRWSETLKISVSFEQFATSHVRFLFKHRSSNETKDRSEKPFAVAYLLLKSADGTALQDKSYRLAVYRIDPKKFTEDNGSIPLAYLDLPSEEQNVDLSNANVSNGDKKTPLLPSAGCYMFSPRETFVVTSLVCSTKLTQNLHLLGLLKWKTSSAAIRENLQAMPMLKDRVQVVRFLQDILDVLFDILSHSMADMEHDPLVFEALVYLINLVTREFQHFRPILDLYIKENFCAATAYHKLMRCLSQQITNTADIQDKSRKMFIDTLKSSEYLFKFIIQSRLLYSQLNTNDGETEFKVSMEKLLKQLSEITQHESRSFQTIQGSALKHIPTIIPDLLRVLDPVVVSGFFVDFIGDAPLGRIFPQQVDSILAVVQSSLFRLPECRKVLLPSFCRFLRELIVKERDFVRCAEVMEEMWVLLADEGVGGTHYDVGVVVVTLLRDTVKTVIHLGAGTSPNSEEFLVILLSIFRQMTEIHYEQLIATFDIPGEPWSETSNKDLLDLLQEIFVAFRSLFSKSMFAKEWADMIMLQNTVMLQVLRQISLTIRTRFLESFDYQLWNNFFQCAVSFCTQESLQLELFSDSKQTRVRRRYEDMRLKMCLEVRAMWNSLGSHKPRFVPDLVACLLDLSLIPVEELRRAIIPIFYDMMQCEYRLIKATHSTESAGLTTSRRELHEYRTILGKLDDFHHEMMKALDVYIEGGRGDVDYMDMFETIMTERCTNNSQMRDKSLRLVNQLVEQMKLLFEYRDVMLSPDVDVESRMCCTVNLLEYYERICKREMYIRYLYKLRDLHLHLGNYTEVAFTLELHARLLLWTDENLLPQLKSPDFPECDTHRELKEKLFYEMIRYFDMGKSWEYAINKETGVFKELLTLYESDTYDYRQLSALLKRMAEFYDKVISPQEARVPCEYFRVAYYGRGFPMFWRNKAFVYRGKECDNIRDFTERQQNRFPECVTLKTMKAPEKEVSDSEKMYLQIWKVDPVPQMDDRFSGKTVSHRIRSFYQFNDISTFTYHRRLHSNTKDADFANLWLERTTITTKSPLPGILRWAQITNHSTDQISPVQTAIETLQAKNDDIHRLVEKHLENPMSELDPQMGSILGGVVDPAVNGGISNYEKAFFSLEYLASHPSPEDREKVDALKELIANQIPLLDAALQIYDQKVKPDMRPFYNHINECFKKQKSHVEEHYGGARPSVFPKLIQKRPIAARAYSNVEIRKNGSFVSYADSGTFQGEGTIRNNVAPKRTYGSLSTLSTLTRRESRDSSVPVELSQPLHTQRPRRETERRSSRPGSGHFTGRRPSSQLSFAEEENPSSPPPLPVKKGVGDYSSNGGWVQNGFATTPRRRKTLDDIHKVGPPEKPPLLGDVHKGDPPEKPPFPSNGLTPDLPPKGGRRSVSPRVRGASATPPPVPEKPPHLVKSRGDDVNGGNEEDLLHI